MKFYNVLNDIFNQASKVKILRCLVQGNREMNGRKIAQEVGLSPATGHQALNSLCSQGILVMRNVGNTHLFQLNGGNYLVKELLTPLFQKEKKVPLVAVQELIKDIDIAINSIVLFGSMARKKEKPYSDIDILVLVPKARDRRKAEKFFTQKNEYFISRFGNILSPYVLSIPEFRKRYQRRDRLIRKIVSTGRVIYGKPITEIL